MRIKIIFLGFVSLVFFSNAIAQKVVYKQNISQAIVDNIASAYGTGRIPPKLEVIPKISATKRQILMYYPGSDPKIVMDEDVYDLCVSFGKDSLNALAALLGHELAHHYERHDWCTSFSYLTREEQQSKQKLTQLSNEEKLRIEAQADYYGGYYGYVAGYSTFDISNRLLDEIYKYYRLPEKLKGYPTKEERKQIAKNSLKEIEQYKAMFEAGNFMLCLKEFEMAGDFFKIVSDKFPSREMYNNAAVAYILNSLEEIGYENMPFILPVEFDAQTRLKTGKTRGIGEENSKINFEKLLLEAIQLLEEAEKRDPTYFSATINKSCAYLLLKNYNMSLGIINQFFEQNSTIIDNNIKAKALTIKGISEYYLGDKEKAEEDLKLTLDLRNSSNDRFNYKLYSESERDIFDDFYEYVYSFFDEDNTASEAKEIFVNANLEKISSVTAQQQRANEKHKKSEFSLVKMKEMYFFESESSSSLILIGTPGYSILSTGNNYKGITSQSIGIGIRRDEIEVKYGIPTYSMNSSQGSVLVYRKSRIIFKLDQSNKLIGWSIYSRM